MNRADHRRLVSRNPSAIEVRRFRPSSDRCAWRQRGRRLSGRGVDEVGVGWAGFVYGTADVRKMRPTMRPKVLELVQRRRDAVNGTYELVEHATHNSFHCVALYLVQADLPQQHALLLLALDVPEFLSRNGWSPPKDPTETPF